MNNLTVSLGPSPPSWLTPSFLPWMYNSVFLKCRMTASAVLVPSMRPDVAPVEGCTSVEWMLSMLEVMSSTRELMCFALIYDANAVSGRS
jgi:hypothetical protein